MAAAHQKPEAIRRGARMLRTALGPAIARFLENPAIVEVILNPDGRLWIDRLSEGLNDTGERFSPDDGERIVRLVAHHVGVEVRFTPARLLNLTCSENQVCYSARLIALMVPEPGCAAVGPLA